MAMLISRLADRVLVCLGDPAENIKWDSFKLSSPSFHYTSEHLRPCITTQWLCHGMKSVNSELMMIYYNRIDHMPFAAGMPMPNIKVSIGIEIRRWLMSVNHRYMVESPK